MKVHYLNCGTLYPRGASLILPHMDRCPCLCLLIETHKELILVDTGLSSKDLENTGRMGLYGRLMGVRPNPDESAKHQIERLGYQPKDVRHIICTHLDRDHASGLSDFPSANIHVTLAEKDACLNPQTFAEKHRYHKPYFSHDPKWITYERFINDGWYGLNCVTELVGLPPEIVLIPLPGHTRGHCGVAVNTKNKWILHCGDAYYIKEELRQIEGPPIDIKVIRHFVHIDLNLAKCQVEKFKNIIKNSNIKMIASHDQFEYRNIFGKPID